MKKRARSSSPSNPRPFLLESLETRALLSASTIPTTPTFLAPGPQSPTSVLLACPANSSNSDPFTIFRSADGITFTQLAIVPANTTVYTDCTVAPNTRYAYWIQTRSQISPDTHTRLAAPTALRNTSTSSSMVALAWNGADPTATGYYILRATNGGDLAPIARIGSPVITNFHDATVVQGNTYSYAVEAFSATANSAASSNITAAVRPQLTVTSQGFSIRAGLVQSTMGFTLNEYAPSVTPTLNSDGSLTYVCPGWTVTITPTSDATGIHFAITFTNTSSATATLPNFQLCKLSGGLAPFMWASSQNGPLVLDQTLSDGTHFAVTMDDPTYPMVVDLVHSYPDGTDYVGFLANGAEWFQDFNSHYDLGIVPVTVAPGQSTSFHASLRFGTDTASVSAATNATWAQAYPYSLQWTDHRLMLRGDMFQYVPTPSSPQGFQGGFDINDPANGQKFDDWVMAYAATNIATCKADNAGTWIEWDLEGSEQTQFNYKGSPQLIEALNPGWDHTDASGVKLIDRFFKAFKDAGIHIGVCLRPWTLKIDSNGNLFVDNSVSGVQSVTNQMDYCINRWGLDAFYLDSPQQNQTAAYRAMMQARPNVLLVPEDVPESWLQFCAPLVFASTNIYNWVTVPRDLYGDQAWAIYFHQDLSNPTTAANFRADVALGSSILINGWVGGDPELPLVTTFFPPASSIPPTPAFDGPLAPSLVNP